MCICGLSAPVGQFSVGPCGLQRSGAEQSLWPGTAGAGSQHCPPEPSPSPHLSGSLTNKPTSCRLVLCWQICVLSYNVMGKKINHKTPKAKSSQNEIPVAMTWIPFPDLPSLVPICPSWLPSREGTQGSASFQEKGGVFSSMLVLVKLKCCASSLS